MSGIRLIINNTLFMNKIIKNVFAVAVICTVGSFALVKCSKQRIQSVKTYNPVSTYLDIKKQTEQEFIIDSTGNGPIVGKQGTKIWGGKQCLQFPNGDSVKWPFTVKLVELYTAKDMIYYQMPTVAGGAILKTDGEIRLRAFKNGTELQLKTSPCSFQIEMPNASPQANMRVFYGINASSASTNYVDWTDNPANVGVTTNLSPLFTTTTAGYQASVAKLGWINCDMITGSGNSFSVTFTSSTDDLTNVGLFVYLPATKTVIQAYNKQTVLIPSGIAIKMLAIGVDASNNLFSYYKETTITANLTEDIKLDPITDADLTTRLDKL
jgi:hypothetical protein